MFEYYGLTYVEGVSTIDDIPIERMAEINARNAMLLFCSLQGITQLLMVTPYWKCFSVDGRLHKDIKPTILVFLLYGVVAAAYYAVSVSDALFEWLPVVIFPLPYTLLIIGAVVVWLFTNILFLRKGWLGFITNMVDRWYRKKVDRINQSNTLSEQGIKQDPFKDFTNTIRDANGKIVSSVRRKNDKGKY